MNLIVYYHSGRADGVLTSVLDTYANLSRYIDVELKINTDKVGDFYLLCKRNKFFGIPDIMKCVTLDKTFEAETIITSTKVLYDDIELNCNRLVLLDSFDMAKVKYGVLPLPQIPCKNTILLCNPATMIDQLDCKEYYHKFNTKRLNTMTVCEQLLYMRVNKDHIYMKGGIYFENIGKSIFEMLYLNKSVSYYGDQIHDGLYYYLQLLGIDGEKDYIPLPLTPKDIEEKLTMKDDDLLLEIL